VASCRSVDPGIRVTVHGSSDPWATESFAPVQPAVGDGVDGVVASCWDPPAGSRRIKDLRALAAPGAEVGADLRLDRGWPPDETTERRLQEYLLSGMTELHLPPRPARPSGLATMRRVIETTSELAARAGPPR
jgi:hypothetical protein